MAPRSPYRVTGSRIAIAAAGSLAVVIDLALVRFTRLPELTTYAVRGAAATAVLLALLLSRRATPADFGLTFAGWRDDVAWGAKLSALVLSVALMLAFASVLAVRLGWVPFPDLDALRDFRDLAELRRYLLSALLCAPLVEELVYRGLAVPALTAVAGARAAVLLSGPLFYLLHTLIYAWPWFTLHYAFAGWVLAWAFVRRGRLWVALALHLLGNILAGMDDAALLFAPDLVYWLLGR
jgi:membrane protease YdiL (CAAX protease family)